MTSPRMARLDNVANFPTMLPRFKAIWTQVKRERALACSSTHPVYAP
jgi:hypothetical protein